MNPRSFFVSLVSALSLPALAGPLENETSSTSSEPTPIEEPFKFSAEFTLEQTYVGGSEVKRGSRTVNDFDEYYSNLLFVYTPRIKFGILRLGGQWERYSFGFP